jgi:eukaryotic-like serine/threonine-protein kinase
MDALDRLTTSSREEDVFVNECGPSGGFTGVSFGRFIATHVLGQGGMGVVLAAFDPELDRNVAIKVLLPIRLTKDESGEQLQREAQAMARLNHPNVATIYEVGRANEHLFIAMELIEGGTLKGWLEAEPRGWREILAMFVAAGRGLEAAHAAGLVHRDFKPENVLIGRDGRPRVSDFGLVTEGIAIDGAELQAAEITGALTSRGIAAGTPAFMSPEQWAGTPSDSRGDQFAFCVALWTALFGDRPFEGTSALELREAVMSGRRAKLPARSAVPRWLVSIVGRGLEIDPQARWSSMTALLAEIVRRSARRRAMLFGAGAAAAALGAAVAAWAMIHTGAASDPCTLPSARLAEVWSPSRAAALRGRAAAIDPLTGVARAAAATAVLDRLAPAWSATHVAVCRATRVEGGQSERMLDARMRCLDDSIDSMRTAVAALERASEPASLLGAVQGVSSLRAATRCQHPGDLEAMSPLPEEPGKRALGEAIRDELKAITSDRKAGKLDGLAARTEAVLARARTLAHPPLLAKALGVRWRVAVTTTDDAGALKHLRELTEVAARAHDDREVALAWSMMGRLSGRQGHPESAKVMMNAARTAAARAGDAEETMIQVLNDEADVLVTAGEYAPALANLTEARALLEQQGAQQPGSPLAIKLGGVQVSLGIAYHQSGRFDQAVGAFVAAAAVFDRALGPDTPEAAAAQIDLAQSLHALGRYGEAEVAAGNSVRVRQLRTGDSPSLAQSLVVQATILAALGRLEPAQQVADRAVHIARSTMASDDSELANIEVDRAEVLAQVHHEDEALATYERVLSAADRSEIKSLNVAVWWLNRADLERRLRRCPEALRHLDRAAEVATAIEGDRSRYLGQVLRRKAQCLQELHRDRDAIDHFERSLAYPVARNHEQDARQAQRSLGQLLIDTRRDPGRGRRLIEEARAGSDIPIQSDATPGAQP